MKQFSKRRRYLCCYLKCREEFDGQGRGREGQGCTNRGRKRPVSRQLPTEVRGAGGDVAGDSLRGLGQRLWAQAAQRVYQ